MTQARHPASALSRMGLRPTSKIDLIMAPAGRLLLILGILIALSPPLFPGSPAGSLAVTVKDPAGRLVVGATVELIPQSRTAIRTLPTGDDGRAAFDPLSAGDYGIAVTKPGFDRAEMRVAIAERAVDLAVSLKLSAVSASVRVSARRSPLANSDPNYQGLRHNRLIHVYRVSNLTLNRDAGVFTFRAGSFSFLPPVQGRVTTGVFIGEGSFRLDPADNLKRLRTIERRSAWGNTVTPATFHDQWIAAGLSGFSSALYDLAAANGNFRDRWEEASDRILRQNRGGGIPNDAGPVTNGLLNDTPGAPLASPVLNDSKGAFVIHMLSSLMWDPQTLDRDFQATMHEFVTQFANRPVSTEDFQAIVEKHMKPVMDLEGNRRMAAGSFSLFVRCFSRVPTGPERLFRDNPKPPAGAT